jgi:hypothetical protein
LQKSVNILPLPLNEYEMLTENDQTRAAVAWSEWLVEMHAREASKRERRNVSTKGTPPPSEKEPPIETVEE